MADFDGSEGGGEGKHAGSGCIDPNEPDRRSFDRKWPGATRAAWSRRPHEVEKSRSSRPPVKRVLSCCGARAQLLTLYDYHLRNFATLRSVPPRAYPSRNPDLTLACATTRAHDECAHFCSWTGWATQKASISSFLSCPMHGATVAALILIACSSVVESADMRLLEQGRGGQKAACSWLERWLGPSDGFAPRDACSGFSTAHLAMLQ